MENGRGNTVAYCWEGEPADQRLTITYADLRSRVVKAANAFGSLGIGKWTEVAVYMGMIPESPVTTLALARPVPRSPLSSVASARTPWGTEWRRWNANSRQYARGVRRGLDETSTQV
ncbi:hypothetical protein GCM10022261_15210 [Brevibacterium daeguense]|uniref:AMP-dependent synthetase/ligase domain-containing protein n=1 Tax=Brevibacterium daeguense TaxID=909936 RepID=A0ABP8EJC5_9MICO